MMRLTHIAILTTPALCALVLAGCGSTEPKEPLIHTPGTGSSFIYTYYSKDSSGRPIELTRRTVSRSVLATGVSVMGKNSVVQYLEDGDTINVHYEENGDASFLQAAVAYPNNDMPELPGLPLPSVTLPARWVTFPYGSRTAMAIPSFDTTIMVNVGGFPIPVTTHATGTTTYLKDEELSISGETIATNKGLLTLNITFTVPLLATGSVSVIDTIWFAPKLGMFIKDDGFSHGIFPEEYGGERDLGGTYNILTSYTLK